MKIRFNWSVVAIMISWVLWYAARYYLQNVKGMLPTYNPDGEFMIRIQQSIESLGFRVMWQFEAWWLIILAMFYILWQKKDYLSFMVIGIATAASSLSAMIIYDSTRSGTFAFVSIFFSLYVVSKDLTKKQLRIILFLIALLCLLHPLASKTHGVGFFLM